MNYRKITIGRDSSCDLIIDHDSISRRHAELFIDEDTNVFITELHSKNGTYVNNSRIYDSRQIVFGDKILIGNASQFKSIWSDPYIRSDSLEELNIISTGWYSYSPYWVRRVEMYGLNSTNLGDSLINNSNTLWMSDDENTKVIAEAIYQRNGYKPDVEKIGSLVFDQGEYAAYRFSDSTN